MPNDISLRELTKEHESHPRNPLIADVLFACKMIERWGRGTQDIIDFCKEAGNPKPKFIELTGSFTVVFPLKEPISGYQVERQQKLELTPRQREILKLLRENQLNGADIAEKLSDRPSVRTIQKDLAKLEKAGIVNRKGKARAIVWSVVK